MTALRVAKTATGAWAVMDGDEPLAEFPTNAQAWRWADIQMHEATNRKQAAHDWSITQRLRGE